jgi:hypothetical protein
MMVKGGNKDKMDLFIWGAIALTSGIIWFGVSFYTSFNQAKAQQQGQVAQQSSNQQELESCIDNVDTWWNQNATTNLEAVDLVPSQEQQVQECQARYPVTGSSANQSQLQSCLTDADNWYSQDATSVYLENYVLPVKQSMVLECQARYPTN